MALPPHQQTAAGHHVFAQCVTGSSANVPQPKLPRMDGSTGVHPRGHDYSTEPDAVVPTHSSSERHDDHRQQHVVTDSRRNESTPADLHPHRQPRRASRSHTSSSYAPTTRNGAGSVFQVAALDEGLFDREWTTGRYRAPAVEARFLHFLHVELGSSALFALVLACACIVMNVMWKHDETTSVWLQVAFWLCSTATVVAAFLTTHFASRHGQFLSDATRGTISDWLIVPMAGMILTTRLSDRTFPQFSVEASDGMLITVRHRRMMAGLLWCVLGAPSRAGVVWPLTVIVFLCSMVNLATLTDGADTTELGLVALHTLECCAACAIAWVWESQRRHAFEARTVAMCRAQRHLASSEIMSDVAQRCLDSTVLRAKHGLQSPSAITVVFRIDELVEAEDATARLTPVQQLHAKGHLAFAAERAAEEVSYLGPLRTGSVGNYLVLAFAVDETFKQAFAGRIRVVYDDAGVIDRRFDPPTIAAACSIVGFVERCGSHFHALVERDPRIQNAYRSSPNASSSPVTVSLAATIDVGDTHVSYETLDGDTCSPRTSECDASPRGAACAPRTSHNFLLHHVGRPVEHARTLLAKRRIPRVGGGTEIIVPGRVRRLIEHEYRTSPVTTSGTPSEAVVASGEAQCDSQQPLKQWLDGTCGGIDRARSERERGADSPVSIEMEDEGAALPAYDETIRALASQVADAAAFTVEGRHQADSNAVSSSLPPRLSSCRRHRDRHRGTAPLLKDANHPDDHTLDCDRVAAIDGGGCDEMQMRSVSSEVGTIARPTGWLGIDRRVFGWLIDSPGQLLDDSIEARQQRSRGRHESATDSRSSDRSMSSTTVNHPHVSRQGGASSLASQQGTASDPAASGTAQSRPLSPPNEEHQPEALLPLSKFSFMYGTHFVDVDIERRFRASEHSGSIRWFAVAMTAAFTMLAILLLLANGVRHVAPAGWICFVLMIVTTGAVVVLLRPPCPGQRRYALLCVVVQPLLVAAAIGAMRAMDRPTTPFHVYGGQIYAIYSACLLVVTPSVVPAPIAAALAPALSGSINFLGASHHFKDRIGMVVVVMPVYFACCMAVLVASRTRARRAFAIGVAAVRSAEHEAAGVAAPGDLRAVVPASVADHIVDAQLQLGGGDSAASMSSYPIDQLHSLTERTTVRRAVVLQLQLQPAPGPVDSQFLHRASRAVASSLADSCRSANAEDARVGLFLQEHVAGWIVVANFGPAREAAWAETVKRLTNLVVAASAVREVAAVGSLATGLGCGPLCGALTGDEALRFDFAGGALQQAERHLSHDAHDVLRALQSLGGLDVADDCRE